MNLAPVQAALSRLASWALRRARERSTWIGLAGATTALGYSALGRHLTGIADFLPMILGSGGLAIATATTSPHPDADADADQADGGRPRA